MITYSIELHKTLATTCKRGLNENIHWSLNAKIVGIAVCVSNFSLLCYADRNACDVISQNRPTSSYGCCSQGRPEVAYVLPQESQDLPL